MIIGEKMEKSINEQICAEFESSYLYLSMSAWFESRNLPGCAHWMNMQAHEEWGHGMKFYKYLVSRGGRVVLEGLGKPQCDWKNVEEVFAHVLAHEEKVTSLINSMFELAGQEKDFATKSMLTWFIDEQVEEEEHATAILNKIKMLGETPISLVMLDKELAARS